VREEKKLREERETDLRNLGERGERERELRYLRPESFFEKRARNFFGFPPNFTSPFFEKREN
jgi:hypothetical protein